MKKFVAPIALTLCLTSTAAGAQGILQDIEKALPGGNPSPSQINDTRQQVRDMSQSALNSLAQWAPAARVSVEKAAGYAVFSTFGVKILVAGGTTGRGLVVNQRTKAQTFMKMVQVQGGLGFGIDRDRLIFVFTDEQALRNFVEQGWEFGGQANVSAMAGGEGAMLSGAASIAPGVYLYQLTETGLSATFTVSGTKYFLDPELN
jgi:lipid-binding SYLF domain-containing protein